MTVLIGVGFTLASWLQAAEIASDKKVKLGFNTATQLFFILLWPLIAIYCYRAEVTKSIPKIKGD